MKNTSKLRNRRLALRRALCALALGGLAFFAAAPDAAAVGSHKLPLAAGDASFLAAPLHKPRVWCGMVESATATTITVSGAALPAGLGAKDGNGNPGGAFAQYIVIVRWDASAAAPGAGNAGDYWFIESAAGSTLTLNPGPLAPNASVALGDRVEILPLTSLRDLFGGPGGSATIMNKDSNGGASSDEEDVIAVVQDTGFSDEIVFHDGSLTGGVQGYLVGGDGPFTGEFITVGPDQPLFYFRRPGAAATAVSVGHAHRAPLTHFIVSDASAPFATSFGTGFPYDVAIGDTGLQDVAGLVLDSNGGSSPDEEDVLNELTGTGFSADLVYHDGSLTGGIPTWLVAGAPDDAYTINSGRGYLMFRRPGLSTLIFRQAPPNRL